MIHIIQLVDDMNTKDGAFLVLFKDERKSEIFLVRRNDFFTWGITGGGIEGEEKPIEAAIGEAKEETGFKVEVKRYLGVYKIIDPKGKKIKKYLFV